MEQLPLRESNFGSFGTSKQNHRNVISCNCMICYDWYVWFMLNVYYFFLIY